MMDNPYCACNFQLRCAGTPAGIAAFSEASGMGADVDVIHSRDGGIMHSLPGETTYTPVTLRYGVTSSGAMWEWFNSGLTGQSVQKTAILSVLSSHGKTAMSWTLHNAWPSKVQAAPLDVMKTGIAIETLTLVYESIERG